MSSLGVGRLRLVELVADDVPPSDHLADLEDAVRLDGVDAHLLPLPRLVQVSPEAEVLGRVEEGRVCSARVAQCRVGGGARGGRSVTEGRSERRRSAELKSSKASRLTGLLELRERRWGELLGDVDLLEHLLRDSSLSSDTVSTCATPSFTNRNTHVPDDRLAVRCEAQGQLRRPSRLQKKLGRAHLQACRRPCPRHRQRRPWPCPEQVQPPPAASRQPPWPWPPPRPWSSSRTGSTGAGPVERRPGSGGRCAGESGSSSWAFGEGGEGELSAGWAHGLAGPGQIGSRAATDAQLTSRHRCHSNFTAPLRLATHSDTRP